MQVKKDKILSNINAAALQCLADRGFKKTTMANIAKVAQISVGNIYRYYKNKNDLFYELIDENFAKKCKQMIVTKFDQIQEIPPKTLKNNQEFLDNSSLFINFLIKNRLRIIILMEGTEGTFYQNFRQEIFDLILKKINIYQKSFSKTDKATDIALPIIYSNLISGTIALLKNNSKQATLASSFNKLIGYHFSGMNYLLE